MSERNPLHTAFLEDHQLLMGGLAGIRTALQEGDVATAVRLAQELDTAAGPHMQFEEEIFYPELEKKLGHEFVERLYGEHEVGRRAVAALLELGPEGELEDEARAVLIADIETTLEHALSCGTLLSHVDEQDAEARATLLKQLLDLRRSGARWTQLPERRPRTPRPGG